MIYFNDAHSESEEPEDIPTVDTLTPRLETQVEGLGKIYASTGLVGNALWAIGTEGVISLRDLAYARIQQGNEGSITERGGFVREGIVFIPQKLNYYLVSESPSLKLINKEKQPSETEEKNIFANFNPTEYYKQAMEDKGKDPKERRVLILPRKGTFTIPTNRFDNEEVTLWAFKDQAGEYGKFLEELNIKEIQTKFHEVVMLRYIDSMKAPWAHQLYLGPARKSSEIAGLESSIVKIATEAILSIGVIPIEPIRPELRGFSSDIDCTGWFYGTVRVVKNS